MTRPTLRALLRDERGSTVPEAMFASLVTGVLLTLIAGAVASFSLSLGAVITEGTAYGNQAFAETRWRNAVGQAQSITVTDSQHASFTLLRPDGRCAVEDWTIDQGAVTVTRTTRTDTCASPVTSTAETVLLDHLNGGQFTFQNQLGRAITFTGGAATLDPAATMPAGADPTIWNRTAIAAATLEVEAGARAFTSTVPASQRSATAGSLNAPTRYNAP